MNQPVEPDNELENKLVKALLDAVGHKEPNKTLEAIFGLMSPGALIELCIRLRDRRSNRKSAYQKEDEQDRFVQDEIEGYLLNFFADEQIEFFSEPNIGTAYRSVRTAATISNWEVFLDFVISNERWDMLERRPNKSAVEKYLIEQKKTPPGVDWHKSYVANFRRSG